MSNNNKSFSEENTDQLAYIKSLHNRLDEGIRKLQSIGITDKLEDSSYRKTKVNFKQFNDHEIEQYEINHRIELPEDFKTILREVGCGKALGYMIINDKPEIPHPIACINEVFFRFLLQNGVSEVVLENPSYNWFNNSTNKFKDKDIQALYEQKECNRDEYISLILPLPCGDSYIPIHPLMDKEKSYTVCYDVYDYGNINFEIQEKQYSIPFYSKPIQSFYVYLISNTLIHYLAKIDVLLEKYYN